MRVQVVDYEKNKESLKRLLMTDYNLLLVEKGEVKLEWDVDVMRVCDSIGIPREIIRTNGKPTNIIINLTQKSYDDILNNKDKISGFSSKIYI